MVRVRAEGAGDAEAIRAVHVAAFPTVAEADLVDQLNRDGDAVISLVAEEGGQTVGHAVFSAMDAVADGRRLSALGLAPVAVLPERQRQGIGSALIEAGVEEARALGAKIVFVLGEPAYYGRFGFAAVTAAPFRSPFAGPYFQALAFGEGPPFSSGRAEYAPAFAGLE